MYAGGTMDRLVRGDHRVAFVMMSHGEGGRLLERNREGGVDERRDYPRSHVVEGHPGDADLSVALMTRSRALLDDLGVA